MILTSRGVIHRRARAFGAIRRGVARMNSSWQALKRVTLVVAAGLTAGPALGSATDALSAVQALREGGCGGIVPATRPLRHEVALDGVAQQWADGLALAAAAERSGYPSLATSGLHVASTEAGILELLRRSACTVVTSRDLRGVGVYRRGLDSWIVITADNRAPVLPPSVARIAPPVADTRVPAPRVPRGRHCAAAARAEPRALEYRRPAERCGRPRAEERAHGYRQ